MAQPQKIYIPTFISSIDYRPARVLPHVYFWNGTKATNTYYVQSYASGSKNALTASALEEFPYFDNIFLQNDTGSQTLLFNTEAAVYGTAPSSSLYSEYWSKYVELLYNPVTRLINATAIIPLADYFKMELNDVVEWRGNYYHLRSIADYNLSNGECSLELLGPLLSDTVSSIFGGSCLFNFTSAIVGTTTTTTIAPTTSTTSTTLPPSTTSTSTTTIAPTTYEVDYVAVAGGGGGGMFYAGGGGAGGYIATDAVNLNISSSYVITIGAGGAGASGGVYYGSNGNNTTIGTLAITATGGGGGGSMAVAGQNGGSGGGAGQSTPDGGDGVVGQGSDGGNGYNAGSTYSAGGGGGGAAANGGNGSSGQGGAGGNGSLWYDGIYRSGGGGGSANAIRTAGLGGIGGGGAGGSSTGGSSGGANRGGGGGAGGNNSQQTFSGGIGGSGIVIIRYSGTPRGTGGTITQNGGYTYHTFTSSGTYTA